MNNFAISSGGIGEALERSASSLMAANNTIDESIALITAANTVVQDPTAVGTAFKTISMRIRGAKTELEEAGLETEGMVESTAKLREEILALSGVDIMEADGKTFKSTYAILDELAKKWEDLSDIQQATITELIAGKRQGNIVSSLMTNFDTAREALDTSLNSSGSAMAEHAKWSESLEAQINELKAAWQGLSQTFLQSDFLKNGINILTKFVEILEKVIDTFGVIGTIGLGLTGKNIFDALTGGKEAKKTINDVVDSITNLTDVVQNKTNVTRQSTEANVEHTASETAEAAANAASATAEKAEAQATMESTNAEMAETKANAASATSETAEATANVASASSELKEAEANAASAASETAEATANVASAASEAGGALSKAGNAAGNFSTTMSKAGGILGIILAVLGLLISLIGKGKRKAQEAAEAIGKLTEGYKQNHAELKKLQSDYDASNESSMINKYAKLSKGVDNLGRNVSLTADEYSEYQNITNKIAEQIPSLVSGYDEQGNALLSVKGNVEELTAAYEKLIHTQNQDVLAEAGTIENNYAKNKKTASGTGMLGGHGVWKGFFMPGIPLLRYFMNASDYELKGDTVEDIQALLEADDEKSQKKVKQDLKLDRFARAEIRDALQNAGVEVKWWQNSVNVLAKTIEDDPRKVQSILDDYETQFDEIVAQQQSIMTAKLSEAFDVSSAISGLDYGNIGEDLQQVAYQVVNSLDKKFFDRLLERGESAEDWVEELLEQLNAISAEDNAEIEAAFDLQTQFNGGEIAYGEYIQGLKDVETTIDGLKIKSKAKKQLKINLGLDDNGVVAEYNSMLARLSGVKHEMVLKNIREIGFKDIFSGNLRKEKVTVDENPDFDISESEAKKFLDGLSSQEFSVLVDIIPELSATEYKETVADIKEALRIEMMLQGFTFDLNLEVETAGIEALNTALAESVSATGLSAESIAALKGRYADLEAQGYDLSSVFEETSHGIRINRQEFSKLEKAYATQKLADVDSDLQEMKNAYDDIGEAIKNCDDPIRKSELFNDRQTLAKRISEAATLASQYEGLTSAYNDWLSAEAAGQERDMYEKIIEGFENVDDEISRGWIDDGTIEFLELLTGRTDLAGKSGKQLKEIYDDLDDTIQNTTYSVRDFFTVDKDGNSTNTGVYNFLDAIGQLEEEKFGGKDVVKRDDNGNIIGFDFEVAGGDEAIAEALGISKELVQIMVRASDDAGFVVSLDGTYRQLADLQNEAKAAADYLHQIGKTDFEFDFNTSSVESLKTQLEEAHKILDNTEFWNKDGTFNFNADGATQAMQVVSTLQAKLDKLSEEKYGIGLTVEDEKFEEPLEKLQEYGYTVQRLNQLKLNPEANAEDIEMLEGNLDTIAQDLIDLSKNDKIDIGIEANDNIDDVKKKIENGEIKIPTVLDIQANMDKNIETLADLALLNSGLLSEDEEKVIRQKYTIEAEEVDTSDVENKTNNKLNNIFGNLFKNPIRAKNIEIIAQTLGIEDVDELSSKLEGIDDKTVLAIAQAIGKGDVDALTTAVEGMDDNTVQAVANALGYSDVETLKAAINNMQGNEVDATVNTDGQSEKINTLQDDIDGLKGKDVFINIVKNTIERTSSAGKRKANQRTGADPAGNDSDVNGTAHVNGTTGRAFARGNWRTKRTETALTGELGREIVVTPDNHWYTVGDTGAEFASIPKGSIVFNHRQTEELFKNGRVTSGGGRGKAFAEGTAWSRGTGGLVKITEVAADGTKGKTYTTTKTSTKKTPKNTTTTTTTTTSSNSGSSGGSGGSGGGAGKVDGSAVGSQDKFEETFDWVAIAIERIEREINNLDKIVGNVYKSWGDRNTALTSEIAKVGTEIQRQNNAATRYLTEANSVGLGESWAKKVREGTLDINTITDEDAAEKIKEYQKWYELYLQSIDKAEQLKQTEAELYEQRFELIQSQYDGILQGFEHTESMLNEYISQAEAKGHIASKNYYQALISNERDSIAELQKERAALIAARDEAVANSDMDIGDEAWYDMCAEIDSVTQAIEEGNTALIEYANSMRDIDWEVFDLIQERISDITAESNFLIDLMSYDKLFDDNGKLTDKGMATMGLHGQNYNTYMYQADEYAKEIADIDRRMALDPKNEEYLDPLSQDVINRRRELVELQRESILAAEDEKQAIKDLVEEGINLELEALQERIDLHNEELQSIKDLYDYQKNVQKQSEEIAALEKQRAAYLSDDSEESKAKLQEITVSLKEAKENLQETEYDKYISDQSALLDSLYEEYELILNQRLDNVDALLSDMITEINSNAVMISSTLSAEATNVGTTLSETMKGVWENDGAAKSVIAEYGAGFQSKQTTTNIELGKIVADVNAMVDDIDEEADTKIDNNDTKPSSKVSPTTNAVPPKKEEPKREEPTVTNDTLMGIASAIWTYGAKSGWGNDPIRSTQLIEVFGKSVAKKVQDIINTYGSSGQLYKFWVNHGKNLSQYMFKAFASGSKRIDESQLAWTQENGQEFIVRPSDGAILTPVAKGDSVLTSTASNNIWDMANSPAEFIKDNLNLGVANVPNNSSVQSSFVQNFENIVFSMPNVKNYGELLSELQKDPKFDKLIKAMTLDQIAGKSSLAKNKSIR